EPLQGTSSRWAFVVGHEATPPRLGWASCVVPRGGRPANSSVEVLAVHALVPHALGIQPEHGPHPAGVAVPDDVARGRRLVLRGPVPLQRFQIPVVDEPALDVLSLLHHRYPLCVPRSFHSVPGRGSPYARGNRVVLYIC